MAVTDVQQLVFLLLLIGLIECVVMHGLKVARLILHTPKFCDKMRIFFLPIQQGRSGASLNDNNKLADLEVSQLGTRISELSPIG